MSDNTRRLWRHKRRSRNTYIHTLPTSAKNCRILFCCRSSRQASCTNPIDEQRIRQDIQGHEARRFKFAVTAIYCHSIGFRQIVSFAAIYLQRVGSSCLLLQSPPVQAEVDITIRVLMKAGAYNDALRSFPRSSTCHVSSPTAAPKVPKAATYSHEPKANHPAARTNAWKCVGASRLMTDLAVNIRCRAVCSPTVQSLHFCFRAMLPSLYMAGSMMSACENQISGIRDSTTKTATHRRRRQFAQILLASWFSNFAACALLLRFWMIQVGLGRRSEWAKLLSGVG